MSPINIPMDIINDHSWGGSIKRIELKKKGIILTYVNGDKEIYYAQQYIPKVRIDKGSNSN